MKKIICPVFLMVTILTGAAHAVPAHYCVMEFDGARTKLLSHRIVDIGLRSMDEEQVEKYLNVADNDNWRFRIRVHRNGITFFHSVVKVPRIIRVEHPGQDQIEGYEIPLEKSIFAVRIPVIYNTRLHIAHSSGTEMASIDLGAFPQEQSLYPAADPTVIPSELLQGISNGPRTNRLKLLVMGDGYTSNQKDKFLQDGLRTWAGLSNEDPFLSYIKFFNVDFLFTASAEEGSDHPPYVAGCIDMTKCCGDIAGQNDPLQGKFAMTAFDATFCGGNIQRAVVVNYAKVYATAGLYLPDFDHIIVIVNDTTYGGAGGGLSVISMNINSVEVAKHEFGHSFGNLADEYDYGCSSDCFRCDESKGNCPPNATTQLVPLKWNMFVAPGTAMPTPNDPSYIGVGAFEGAMYTTVGVYRPVYNCKMKSLGVPFCPVCSQNIVISLYNGRANLPNGIDLFDSVQPQAGNLFAGHNTFAIQLIKQNHISISWQVNGVEMAKDVASFTYNDSGIVTVVVKDLTALVKQDPKGLLTKSRTWNVIDEMVTAPTLSGPVTGIAGQRLSFAASGSNSSLGNKVQYFFDCGESKNNGWLNSGTMTKSWPVAGRYNVKAKARSSSGVESGWSNVISLTISIQPILISSIQQVTVDVPIDIKVRTYTLDPAKNMQYYLDGVQVNLTGGGGLSLSGSSNKGVVTFKRVSAKDIDTILIKGSKAGFGDGTLNIKVNPGTSTVSGRIKETKDKKTLNLTVTNSVTRTVVSDATVTAGDHSYPVVEGKVAIPYIGPVSERAPLTFAPCP